MSDKATWRRTLSAARDAVSAEIHAAEASALTAAVSALDLPDVVCAYVPFGAEPGSTAMLDVLVAAGARVLLPITGGAEPLRWADYSGPAGLIRGRFGIAVPTTPVLPAETIADVGLILIPALAVDRHGARLGRGAGHYDRTLPHAHPSAPRVAVIRDVELVADLPAEPHDIRMTAALTPTAGLTPLPLPTRPLPSSSSSRDNG
jgi:5-formyltetrahydrofolate cyclo-ligase